MTLRIFCLTVAGLAASAFATTEQPADFSRYQAIIERKPFGAVEGAGKEAPPNWLARWQFVGVTVSNSGEGPVQAILFDKEGNRSYFRAENESIDGGVTVVKIDPDQKPPKVVLKNGLETATLTFPERSAVASAPGAQPQPPATATNPAAPPPTIRRIPFRRSN